MLCDKREKSVLLNFCFDRRGERQEIGPFSRKNANSNKNSALDLHTTLNPRLQRATFCSAIQPQFTQCDPRRVSSAMQVASLPFLTTPTSIITTTLFLLPTIARSLQLRSHAAYLVALERSSPFIIRRFCPAWTRKPCSRNAVRDRRTRSSLSSPSSPLTERSRRLIPQTVLQNQESSSCRRSQSLSSSSSFPSLCRDPLALWSTHLPTRSRRGRRKPLPQRAQKSPQAPSKRGCCRRRQRLNHQLPKKADNTTAGIESPVI